MSAASPTAIRFCPKIENSRGGVSGHDHGELWPEKAIRQEETPARYFAIFAAQIPDPQPTAIRLRTEVDKRAFGIGHDTPRWTLGGVLGLGNQSSAGLGHAAGSSAIKAWGGWAPP